MWQLGCTKTQKTVCVCYRRRLAENADWDWDVINLKGKRKLKDHLFKCQKQTSAKSHFSKLRNPAFGYCKNQQQSIPSDQKTLKNYFNLVQTEICKFPSNFEVV